MARFESDIGALDAFSSFYSNSFSHWLDGGFWQSLIVGEPLAVADGDAREGTEEPLDLDPGLDGLPQVGLLPGYESVAALSADGSSRAGTGAASLESAPMTMSAASFVDPFAHVISLFSDRFGGFDFAAAMGEEEHHETPASGMDIVDEFIFAHTDQTPAADWDMLPDEVFDDPDPVDLGFSVPDSSFL